ncbi:MAG: Ig-like domain-containing protein [Bacteroidales bacterium]|nr:Ig-like domain-containing protein [Bacteroidales bacterium]
MKNKFFYRSLVLAAMALLACNPPEEGEDPQPQPVDPDPEIVIPAESTQIFTEGISFTTTDPEQSQQARVKFSATAAWQATVEDTKSSAWLSVDPSSGAAGDVVMTVTARPNLTDKEREAVVTVNCGEDYHSFTVTQTPYVKPPVEVESVTLDRDKLTLVEGQSATLTATVLPDDADDKTVTWSSSNTGIATVDGGKVSAIKEGVAVITARAGQMSATCEVTVQKYVVDPTSITLNTTSLALEKGQAETLTATVLPEDTTDKTVIWSSSNAAVASVDKNGKVTAIAGGSAVITVTTVNDITAQCQVTVTVPVTSVTLSQTSLSLLEGRTAKLEATVLPEDATEKTVTWTSAIPSVATVSADGTVTAVSAGKVNITAKSGNVSAVCEVTVEAIAVSVTPVSVELGPEGGKVSVKVSSNVSWTASSTAEWFSLSKTSAGDGDTDIEVTVAENETVDARSAQVTFTAEGRTATLSVSQKGIVPELKVAGPAEKLPAAAGTYQLSVTSNIAWTLESSETWLTTSVSSSAKGTVEVSFSITQNDNTAERSATLTFTYGGQTFTHTVTQRGRDDISGFIGSIEDWEDEGAEFNKK